MASGRGDLYFFFYHDINMLGWAKNESAGVGDMCRRSGWIGDRSLDVWRWSGDGWVMVGRWVGDGRADAF